VIDVPSAGRSRIAPLSRDDVAAAAAAVLASDEHRGQVYMSSPVLRLTRSDEIAEVASRAFDVPIATAVLSADYLLRCWATMRDPWPHAFAALFASISQDAMRRPPPLSRI